MLFLIGTGEPSIGTWGRQSDSGGELGSIGGASMKSIKLLRFWSRLAPWLFWSGKSGPGDVLALMGCAGWVCFLAVGKP